MPRHTQNIIVYLPILMYAFSIRIKVPLHANEYRVQCIRTTFVMNVLCVYKKYKRQTKIMVTRWM